MSIVDLALLHVRQIGRQPKILTDTILAGFQELIWSMNERVHHSVEPVFVSPF